MFWVVLHLFIFFNAVASFAYILSGERINKTHDLSVASILP